MLTFHGTRSPSLSPSHVPPHPHATLPSSQLTDNLLKKPPFRFLHDVVSEVIRNTGYARGLFDDRESDSANIKDKETKVAWLNKIIACVSLSLDEHLPARPLKIVAGLEPERTSEFLQALGRAARHPATAPRCDASSPAKRPRNPAPPDAKPAATADAKPAAPPSPPAPPAQPIPAPPSPAPPSVAATFEPLSSPPRRRNLNAPLEPESPVARVRAPGPARPVSARRAPPKRASNVTEVDAHEKRPGSVAATNANVGGGSGLATGAGAAVMREGRRRFERRRRRRYRRRRGSRRIIEPVGGGG